MLPFWGCSPPFFFPCFVQGCGPSFHLIICKNLPLPSKRQFKVSVKAKWTALMTGPQILWQIRHYPIILTKVKEKHLKLSDDESLIVVLSLCVILGHTPQKEFTKSNNTSTIKHLHSEHIFLASMFLKRKLQVRIDVETILILKNVIFIHGYMKKKVLIISLRKAFLIKVYLFEQ